MGRHRTFQERTIIRGRKQNLLLAHGCGVGKTREGMYLIFHKPKPALILAPVSILETVWIYHYKKWMPSLTPVVLWNRSKKVQRRLLEEHHKVYICSYESAKSLYKDIVAKRFKTIVLDESNKARNYKSGNTALVMALAGIHTRGGKFKVHHAIPNRYAMSGTPAPNTLLEYWPQIMFVAGKNRAFHPNYYRFRDKYFIKIPITPLVFKYKFRMAMQAEFNKEMAPWIDVIKTEDVLPELSSFIEIRKIRLSPKERTAYNDMKKYMMIETCNGTIVTNNALTKCLCLRELTSGFLYTKQGVESFGSSKLKELDNLISEIGDNRVIIWYNYEHERKCIMARLGNRARWQGVPKDRKRILEEFEAGKFRYLVANPQSLKYGQNMQYVHHMIFFSLSASYDDFEQCRRRILRDGQKETCAIYILVARNSYDEALLNIVKTKETRANVTLNYFRGI